MYTKNKYNIMFYIMNKIKIKMVENIPTLVYKIRVKCQYIRLYNFNNFKTLKFVLTLSTSNA